MKKGGKIKETGIYKLHSGETVKPAKQVDKPVKLSRASARRLKARARMI
jgi:hypothetical protein